VPQEADRAYELRRARRLEDDRLNLVSLPVVDPETAPAYLAARVAGGGSLPVVRKRACDEGDVPTAVVDFVVKRLKGELFVELSDFFL
jgi:hypothetical protein